MSRRGEVKAWGRAAMGVVAVLIALAGAAEARAADEVAAYLERHGLLELLTVHLEERLEAAAPDERPSLVVRLAEIYAQLLPTIDDDPVRRAAVVERSRRLLAHAPPGSANELNLALLRLRYRTAEETAENHRLRLASDEEVAQARATLDDLQPRLRRLLEATADQVDRAERRLDRASGAEAIMLDEAAEQARLLRSQVQFLAAWALYYRAWMADRTDRDAARLAERYFAELLGFEDRPATPGDVSVDLRSTEAYARCIQGMALCKGLTSSADAALDWIELLRHRRTYETVRAQATAWELAVLLEDGEHLRVRSLLDGLTADGEEISLQWLRLVAVYALEDAGRSSHAAELARQVVTAMAARGELGQVYDLATRYGVEALGTAGFALHYVGGVLHYHEARDAHADDEPTHRADVVALYAKAIEEFQLARASRDAEDYPDSLPDCARLVAWSSFFMGELREARTDFEQAAAALPPPAAADALWMAIVCLDRLVEADGRSPALEDELARLVASFLAKYPTSEHAPKLILRRALTSEEISPDLAEELLAIPESSDVYFAARRRAAQILYRLFRESKGAERATYGTRYLGVAVPMHARDEQGYLPAEGSSFTTYLVRARRILDVSLHDGVRQVPVARSVLEALARLADEEHPELEAVAAELEYRRLRERLLSGDPTAADGIADRLWEHDPEGIWARLGARAMYADGNEARRASTDDASSRPAAALVLKHGSRVLREFAGDPAALAKPDVLACTIAVAEAALVVWHRSSDPQRGREALALFERLLVARPRNARFLRATAVLSEGLGGRPRAIECWRTLVAGSGQGTEPWFEAKYHLLSLLADDDPRHARLVMEQHKLMNPDYGPEPWGGKFRKLDARLRIEAPAGEEVSDAG